jgi:hypothetical protein
MRWVLGLFVLVAACKGDAQKCEQAARNYVTLVFWHKHDPEIAKLPADQQKLAREKKLAELSNLLESGIEHSVKQCQSANDEDAIDCMIAAKTAEQAIKCRRE